MNAIHAAVEAYIAHCALEEADLFPYRGALSGDYDLPGRERYGMRGHALSVSMIIRCLGTNPYHPTPVPRDYLGIDLVLLWHAESREFSTFYRIGMVI